MDTLSGLPRTSTGGPAMRGHSAAPTSRHEHGGTWRDHAVHQGLITDPREIRVVAFPPQLVPLAGGLAPALLLGQLLYWTGKQRDPDGWIYKQQVEFQQET